MKSTLVITALLMTLVVLMSFGSADLLGNEISTDTSASASVNTNTKTNVDTNANADSKVKSESKVVSIADLEADLESDLEEDLEVEIESDDEKDETEVEFSSEGIQKASAEIDASVKKEAKETRFAQVSIGQGWVISSETSTEAEGSLARVFWVEKTFVESHTNTSVNATETTKAKGALKIGSQIYKLTLVSQTDDKMMFDVESERTKVDGSLELDAKTSLLGFTVWSGNLELDSGQDYEVSIATKDSKIKGTEKVRAEIESDGDLEASLDADSKTEVKRPKLWARIRAFFRGG